ncbi:MAG: hypothetical protein WC315_00885 [Candidatus Omnitrophota bacterium]|jgi:hypothetical protein
MKERTRNKLSHTVNLEPGDKLICTVNDHGRVDQFEEKIGRKMTVDTVVTFDVDQPILGLSDGIGAIFGKSIE